MSCYMSSMRIILQIIFTMCMVIICTTEESKLCYVSEYITILRIIFACSNGVHDIWTKESSKSDNYVFIISVAKNHNGHLKTYSFTNTHQKKLCCLPFLPGILVTGQHQGQRLMKQVPSLKYSISLCVKFKIYQFQQLLRSFGTALVELPVTIKSNKKIITVWAGINLTIQTQITEIILIPHLEKPTADGWRVKECWFQYGNKDLQHDDHLLFMNTSNILEIQNKIKTQKQSVHSCFLNSSHFVIIDETTWKLHSSATNCSIWCISSHDKFEILVLKIESVYCFPCSSPSSIPVVKSSRDKLAKAWLQHNHKSLLRDLISIFKFPLVATSPVKPEMSEVILWKDM